MSKRYTKEDGGRKNIQDSIEMLFPVNLDSTGRRLENDALEPISFPTPIPRLSLLTTTAVTWPMTPITPTEPFSPYLYDFNSLEWPKPIISPPSIARTAPECSDPSTRALDPRQQNRRHHRSVSDTGPFRPHQEMDRYPILAGDVNGVIVQSPPPHHHHRDHHHLESIYPIQPSLSSTSPTLSACPLVRPSSSGYTESDFVPLSMAHKPPYTPFPHTDSVLPPSSSSLIHPGPYSQVLPYSMDTSLVPLEPPSRTLRPENLGVLLLPPPSIIIQNPGPIAVHESRVRFEEALMESSRKTNTLSTLTVQRKSDRSRRWSWGGKLARGEDDIAPSEIRSE